MWDDENTIFVTVVNAEEQYSIWPERQSLPEGWTLAGFQGKKKECLQHIDLVWTDMKPASLRKWMEDQS